MKYNPQKHHRRSIRLKNYDYASVGAYFVTMVTHGRQCLFGEIVDGTMRLNEWGKIAKQFWMEIPKHYPHVSLDVFVIMPNHVHGIIILNEYHFNGPIVVGVQNFEPLQQYLNGSVNIPIFIPYGNAIITNTSSVMKPNCNASAITLQITQTIGKAGAIKQCSTFLRKT